METTERLQAIKDKITEISLSEDFVRNNDNYPSGKHVCLVFQDGEMSSTKAGGLLHQRTLHLFEYGDKTKTIPIEWFPYRMGNNKENGYVFCTHDNGKILSEMILEKKHIIH